MPSWGIAQTRLQPPAAEYDNPDGSPEPRKPTSRATQLTGCRLQRLRANGSTCPANILRPVWETERFSRAHGDFVAYGQKGAGWSTGRGEAQRLTGHASHRRVLPITAALGWQRRGKVAGRAVWGGGLPCPTLRPSEQARVFSVTAFTATPQTQITQAGISPTQGTGSPGHRGAVAALPGADPEALARRCGTPHAAATVVTIATGYSHVTVQQPAPPGPGPVGASRLSSVSLVLALSSPGTTTFLGPCLPWTRAHGPPGPSCPAPSGPARMSACPRS